MDKNTLIGLLLIGALLFGFTLCTDHNKDTRTDDKDKVTKVTDNPEAADNAAPTINAVADSALTASLRNAVTAYGTTGADSTRTLATANATLTLDAEGNLTGTVSADGRKLNLNAVLDNADSSVAPEVRAAALSVLRGEMGSTQQYREFAQFLGGEDKEITVENGKIRVTFSSRGGRISKVVLPGYKTENTTPPTDIVLLDPKSGEYSFEMQTANQRINTATLNFRATQVNDTVVEMTLPMGAAELTLRYTVLPDEYLVRMEMLQKGMDKVIPANRTSMALNWHQTLHRNEVGRSFEERNSAIYYKFDGENPDDLSANSNDDEQLSGNLKWVAFKNQFFSSVLIARDNLATADLNSVVVKKGNDLKTMDMAATFDYSSLNAAPAAFVWYFGPNSYPLLSDLDDTLNHYVRPADGDDEADLQLNKLVPLGWGIFGWINRWATIPVFTFLSKYIANYGIIILILTLLVKLVLFPLTYKSYMSQAKMRVLAPEIKEINEKYPGQENAMKRQQETMKLYSRAGASPFSGCLPMLLQMPILIAMFSFFPSAIELRGQSFLWAHDLSAPDFICTLPFSIPFLGNRLSLFCLLMTAVNIVYTRINMQNQPSSTSMPGMKWMMYLMPVMFLFFFNDYASGLTYYYFLSLLITILQTYAFRWWMVDEKKVRAEMEENAKKPRKKTGLMARLEAAQRKQEAMMREQQKRQGNRRR